MCVAWPYTEWYNKLMRSTHAGVAAKLIQMFKSVLVLLVQHTLCLLDRQQHFLPGHPISQAIQDIVFN